MPFLKKKKSLNFTSILLISQLLWNFTSKVVKYLKMGELALVGATCQSNFVWVQIDAEHLKVKRKRLCERNDYTFTLNSCYRYPSSCFHFIVNEIKSH